MADMAIPQQVACSSKSHPGKCDESSDIRVHFGISEEEKAAVKNRGEHVLKALKNLGLDVKKGPVVSVLVSGGGLRAAIACQGVLSELSHVGLLDTVTYLAGVSGSTWCMSSLYTENDGWKDLGKMENELRRRLQEDSWMVSVSLDGLCVAAERDDYSLTDFWSYSAVYYLTKELLGGHLSHAREQSEMGTVPYPIFASINHDLKSSGKEKNLNAWFEFTPDWAGYSTPGAYVSTALCGSKFEGGKLVQQEPERDFSYLRAVCGSPLADINVILKTIWDFFKKFIHGSSTQEEMLLTDPEDTEDKLLTEKKNMYLMDAGSTINSAYPLVLPPIRSTDIILSFDFSAGDPFKTIKATEKYCKACNIPFPLVDDAKLDQEAKAPSDLYIFEGENAPVVMHFPLFNKVNCGSKDVIEQRHETYATFRLTNYSDDEVCQLLEDSKANVRNNKDCIFMKISELAKPAS
ncbi:cytosolic phospholipase A2 gamma isoform X6 [Vombatus ursinus]|uniref:cytosolic phospholipase A2 gamma isoform X6 n=1 Tax=Vombatus ursinus TaxID=29139 RepID=UPI000FFCF5FC|nr:cytosolic phospholipase A2 gamma isoform X6 [Vombatus ursinus]